jgi:hypothetical protein
MTAVILPPPPPVVPYFEAGIINFVFGEMWMRPHSIARTALGDTRGRSGFFFDHPIVRTHTLRWRAATRR